MERIMAFLRGTQPHTHRPPPDNMEGDAMHSRPGLEARARLAQIKAVQAARRTNRTLDVWEGRDPMERELTGEYP